MMAAQNSILLSNALDCIGYNEDMVKYRQAYWKLKADLTNLMDGIADSVYFIAAGSQAEGVVKERESDWDYMFVIDYALCTHNSVQYIDERNKTIFQTVNHDTEPGYTKLKLFKINVPLSFDLIFRNSMFKDMSGDYYMSSEFFVNGMMSYFRCLPGRNTTDTNATLTKSGPALPIVEQEFPFTGDLVFAFKCNCPEILQSWLRRPRRFNWPPRTVIYDISQLEAHVVPVGCKGSDTYYQEWRICFTKAEKHLIHNLNATQTKLYIVLKMVAKQILKQICPEMTSYIMKNIVLWMSEKVPSDMFTIEQLGCRITQALGFLKQCVAQNGLPSYMIPERNLLQGRIDHTERLRLIELLTSYIEEESSVFKIDKIRNAMMFVYRAPEMSIEYRIKKDKAEKLLLMKQTRGTIIGFHADSEQEYENIIFRDKLYSRMSIAIWNTILPDQRPVRCSSQYIDTLIGDTLDHIVS